MRSVIVTGSECAVNSICCEQSINCFNPYKLCVVYSIGKPFDTPDSISIFLCLFLRCAAPCVRRFCKCETRKTDRRSLPFIGRKINSSRCNLFRARISSVEWTFIRFNRLMNEWIIFQMMETRTRTWAIAWTPWRETERKRDENDKNSKTTRWK